MARVEKLEGNLELKSPAEKFYNILKSENHHIPKACSDKRHSIEVREGDWDTPGSIKFWNYTVDGKAEIWKERVEVEEANKKVTFVAIEGHVLDLYKTYKAIIKVERGFAKVTLEYENLNKNVPAPNKYLQLASNILKDIDAHLVKG